MNATTAQPLGRLSADQRRRQLIDTATHLFATRGFSGTTTREIAAAAGVNEAIIFRFFPHKDDLYAAILESKSADSRTDALVETLRTAADAGDDIAVVATVVHHVVDHHRRDPEFLRLMLHSALEGHSFARQYRERHFAPLHAFLLAYIESRQKDGRFRPGHPEALVRVILAVPVYHGLVEVLLPEDGVTVGPDVIDIYSRFILEGLRVRPSSPDRP